MCPGGGEVYTPQGKHPNHVSVILFTEGVCPLPKAVHAGRYGQQAGGTHPTGMQSCYYLPTKLQERNVFSLSTEERGGGPM